MDAVLLGLGTDGHTASLFPGSPALDEASRWVVSTEAHAGQRRLTLTLPVLRAARLLVFLVAGRDKAAVAAACWAAGRRICPRRASCESLPDLDDHRVVWLLDQEAAGDLAGMLLARRVRTGPAGGQGWTVGRADGIRVRSELLRVKT